MTAFDYHEAFNRTVGWVTPGELDRLKSSRVAIAGLGGVGGSHLLTLSRLGIGGFNVADFDTFCLANMNRQAGAFVSTLDQPKAAVLQRMANDINPEADIRVFPAGVNESNYADFLDGVDVYVDGLDLFAVEARRRVFAECARRGIPAVTAAPLGMSAALLCFTPGSMGFEDYFQLEGKDEFEQVIRFLLGVAPAMLHRGYLVHPAAVDLIAHRGPSTPMACELAAAMAGTATLKLILKRGKVVVAPSGIQFDTFRNKLVRTWRPGGNRNPIQKIGFAVARSILAAGQKR